MTAKELLEYEVNAAGRQIDACLNGMSEAAFDAKCAPNGMTPREMIEHLSEAYQAMITAFEGGKHSWGTFVIEDKSTQNLTKVFRDLRSKAVAAALASEDEEAQKHAYDFIVGHDNYHVGQLVLARLQAEPDWDSYAIYA